MTAIERRARLGEFLKQKRGLVRPEQFSLPVHRRRRVSGLRREELALLVGISVTWYTQLESGAPITVSPALLRRLAETLQLSPLERAYLFSLALDEMAIVSTVLSDLEVLAGSRIAAAKIEDEIAMVLRTHRSLKTQIYSALVHETAESLGPHICEERCPIGYWLHEDLAPVYRRSEYYERASRIHADFHREIDRVVAAGCVRDAAQIEMLIAGPSLYAVLSAELERTFGTWRDDLTATRLTAS